MIFVHDTVGCINVQLDSDEKRFSKIFIKNVLVIYNIILVYRQAHEDSDFEDIKTLVLNLFSLSENLQINHSSAFSDSAIFDIPEGHFYNVDLCYKSFF